MVVETETSTFIRDRKALDKAHDLKEKANKAYVDKDYSNAVRLYHLCVLSAKAVVQCSATDLVEMARFERNAQANAGDDVSNADSEKEEETGEAETSGVTEDAEANSSAGGRLRIDSTSRGEEMKQEANDLIFKCYNNLAACILNGPPRQKADYLRAADYCNKVLEMDENNEKAIFRKGCALMKAEKYDKAVEQFRKCSNNAQAKVMLDECNLKLIEDRKKRDAVIRANFAKAHAAEQRNGNADGPVMNGNAGNGNIH
ncbi:tetratricopeptide repeat protein 9A [Ditylenchus destructor]|uniref:Tetratricopeptide repeat protein 9A n=1 Tax=Ditylenchus destructor TaxID=166010 RepID=A0AAD4NC68_9BILA|nr:tetratricopeptide repeat protein 9A [Ditylenchus destructor]